MKAVIIILAVAFISVAAAVTAVHHQDAIGKKFPASTGALESLQQTQETVVKEFGDFINSFAKAPVQETS